MNSSQARRPWVVLLEALSADASLEEVERVLARLAAYEPGSLSCPGRCAVQLDIEATGPDDALHLGLQAWREAVATETLVEWDLVRIEVKTAEELASELQAHRAMSERITSQEALSAAYAATRRLLRVRDASGAAAVVASLTYHLGGEMVAARDGQAQAFPLDLSFGTTKPFYAVAQPLSVSRLHLEETLPLVFDDAWCVLRRVMGGDVGK